MKKQKGRKEVANKVLVAWYKEERKCGVRDAESANERRRETICLRFIKETRVSEPEA